MFWERERGGRDGEEEKGGRDEGLARRRDRGWGRERS